MKDNNRRQFLKQASLAAAGVLILPNLSCMAAPSAKRSFGLQLYSLRNEFSQGVEKVISEVAKAGYKSVETYGYSLEKGFWGLNVKEFKALLDKYKLKCHSSHNDFNQWEKTQDQAILQTYIDAAKVLGQEYIVVPHINPKIFQTEESVKEFAGKLTTAAKLIKEAGLKLAYHNHDFEFTKIGDTTGYEILLREVGADLMDFEIDLYWAVRAKMDVHKLFTEHAGRFTMWHIKDMKKSDHSKNTEVGNGEIDFAAIFKDEKLSGLKYAYVEQENFDIDPYESIQRSVNYLSKMK